MILAPLADADRYAPLHPLFAAAFAWARDGANHALAPGRHALQGERLLVIVEHGATRAADSARFESHRRYIDIQVNLLGPEIIEWLPLAGLAVEDDFQEGGDIAFYARPAATPSRLLLAPGHAAIFWPGDAHKPSCHPAGAMVPLRKLVFKVEA